MAQVNHPAFLRQLADNLYSRTATRAERDDLRAAAAYIEALEQAPAPPVVDQQLGRAFDKELVKRVNALDGRLTELERYTNNVSVGLQARVVNLEEARRRMEAPMTNETPNTDLAQARDIECTLEIALAIERAREHDPQMGQDSRALIVLADEVERLTSALAQAEARLAACEGAALTVIYRMDLARGSGSPTYRGYRKDAKLPASRTDLRAQYLKYIEDALATQEKS